MKDLSGGVWTMSCRQKRHEQASWTDRPTGTLPSLRALEHGGGTRTAIGAPDDLLDKERSTYWILQGDRRDDYKTIAEAVALNGEALWYASTRLRNDMGIVIAAVKMSGDALRFASDALKGVKDVVLEAVRQNGNALRFASEALRRDREVVVAAVTQYGNALQHAADAFKNDREVVVAAARQNCNALGLATDEMRRDRVVIMEAVKRDMRALYWAPPELRGDKEVMMEAVKLSAFALRWAPESLRADRDVILQAASLNWNMALDWAPASLMNALYADAAFQFADAHADALDRYKDDADVVRRAVRMRGGALRHASPQLEQSLELRMLAAETNVDYAIRALEQTLDELRDRYYGDDAPGSGPADPNASASHKRSMTSKDAEREEKLYNEVKDIREVWAVRPSRDDPDGSRRALVFELVDEISEILLRPDGALQTEQDRYEFRR